MRILLFVLGSLWAGLGMTEDAASIPEPVWAVTGLAQPESALYDPARKVIYVSNLAGSPTEKDGKGFISKIGLNGKLLAREWVKGLNAPKGLALARNKLYVADIGELVEIEVTQGKVLRRHPAPDSKFLNDVTADAQGRVYVSDMLANAIWRLQGKRFEPWLQSDALETPNGILTERGRLVVATWGKITDPATFGTAVPGRVKYVDNNDQAIRTLLADTPVGNLDGLATDGQGVYYVSDFLAGKVLRITADGVQPLLTLNTGTADIGLVPGKLLLVPLMNDGELRAYALSR